MSFASPRKNYLMCMWKINSKLVLQLIFKIPIKSVKKSIGKTTYDNSNRFSSIQYVNTMNNKSELTSCVPYMSNISKS